MEYFKQFHFRSELINNGFQNITALKKYAFKIIDMFVDIDLDLNLFQNLCNFCLYNNYVYTISNIYLKNNGISIGTIYSSTAANLYFILFINFNTVVSITTLILWLLAISII